MGWVAERAVRTMWLGGEASWLQGLRTQINHLSRRMAAVVLRDWSESGAETWKTRGRGAQQITTTSRGRVWVTDWRHETQSLVFYLWKGQDGLQTAMKVQRGRKGVWEKQTPNNGVAREDVSSGKSQENIIDFANDSLLCFLHVKSFPWVGPMSSQNDASWWLPWLSSSIQKCQKTKNCFEFFSVLMCFILRKRNYGKFEA